MLPEELQAEEKITSKSGRATFVTSSLNINTDSMNITEQSKHKSVDSLKFYNRKMSLILILKLNHKILLIIKKHLDLLVKLKNRLKIKKVF
jgi:hypothetical protein